MANYFLRRILLMIPTFFFVSLLVFFIQEMAPGDFVDRLMAIQQTSGGVASSEEEMDAMRIQYGLDRSAIVRYWEWFSNFLRGDMGISYEHYRPVNELIGERLLLSAVLSYTTILLTWLISIPAGVWCATHRFSFSETTISILGFIGMSIPNFLLALVFLYFSLSFFGVDLSGLFSPEYVDAPWSVGKVLDLLAHLWIPVVILGTAGTASGIRTWRALTLDTLGEPFIKTARAKGLPESVVIWKHAVPVAANPFLSGIGSVLTAVISGEVIVSITMGLPTTGPLFLEALRSQDTYLSSSFLMLITLLMLVGMLLSDLLLALVDPRIRYQ